MACLALSALNSHCPIYIPFLTLLTRKWQVNRNGVSVEDERKLTDSGKEEQRRMGSRAKKRMPLFFS